MCSLCDHDGAYATCEACRRYTGEDYFPLDRENFDFGRVLSLAWSRYSRQWPMLCVAIVILFGANICMAVVRQLVLLPFSFALEGDAAPMTSAIFLFVVLAGVLAVEVCVVWTISVGVFRVCLDVLMGRPASIPRQLGQFRKMGKVVLQGLAAMIAVGVPAVVWLVSVFAFASLGTDRAPPVFLGALAFVGGLVPFTYYVLPFFFMQIELALGKHPGPVEAIINAAVVIRGKRWIALGTVAMVGLLAFVGMLFCCVGAIPTVAFGQLLASAVYLGLRTGSEVSSPMDTLD